MNKFRKVAAIFIIFELILLAAGNICAIKIYNYTNSGEYKVEINRIAAKLEAGENVNLQDYKSIVSVKKFNPEEHSKFDYAVESVNGQLYRFEYKRLGITKVLVILNVLFSAVIIFTAGLLLYLYKKIISPFRRMNYLTTELAKGNLAVPIKQEKSRYFKQFLWGMDMLREKLEDDRVRELQLLKDKKTLILSLSHDIKTPLAAMDLYTKALKADLYETDEEKSEALVAIEKNILQIKQYVSEIAEASREDFLTLEVNNSEVYLNEIIREIDKYYDEKCRVAHIDFRIDSVDNCMLYGDKDRIIEVIQNIMENAIKYGDGKFIGISFDEEEQCKLITVTNSGCAVQTEELPHLFESFYRGSNSGKENGSGLGLYICKELMHKMDGEIFAKICDDRFCVTVVLRKV